MKDTDLKSNIAKKIFLFDNKYFYFNTEIVRH